MSHTPGPWTICWGTYNGARMNFHITASPHGSVLPIAETRWRHDHAEEDRQRIEANAHLIAAAPDLLEALIISTAMLRELVPSDVSVRETLSSNERTIAKAKGEAE